MATKKKAIGKAKAKRKKTTVTKAATRGKAKTDKKMRAKKAPVQRTPSKKAKPTASAAAKPAPATPPAQPTAATHTLSQPPQPAPLGERIGVVTNYYRHLSVATLRLEPSTTLRVGDMIHIRGHTTDFSQRVESLELNHAPVTEVGPNDDFGLKVVQHAREHERCVQSAAIAPARHKITS